GAKHLAIVEKQMCELGLADTPGVGKDRIEYRGQVTRRTADDLEHLRSRGLLLQRFAQLVEQARVLDGDDRLVSEGGGELNLLLGEWPHGLALQDDDPNRISFAQQRQPQHRASAADLRRFLQYVFRVGHDIGDLDDAPLLQDATENRSAPDWDRILFHERLVFG